MSDHLLLLLLGNMSSFCWSPQAWTEELLLSCGFLLCKGLVGRLDLVSVQLPSRPRLFSFLSLAWGFVADVDMESEKYRCVGTARFLVGTLLRLASLRVYQGRLAYIPAPHTAAHTPASNSTTPPGRPFLCSSPSCKADLDPDSSPKQNSRHGAMTDSDQNPIATQVPSSSSTTPQHGPPDLLLPALHQPLPSSWTVVEEDEFVLVLAIYQSHLSEDLWAAPHATADDGVIHLFYVRAGISRPGLLRLFMAMEKGVHLDGGGVCPHLVYERVAALRLEPLTPQGVITVDGEPVEYGPVQAQVHPGLARIITG